VTILPKKIVQELSAYSKPNEGRLAYIRLDFSENTRGYPDFYPPGIPHEWISAYPEYDHVTERIGDFFDVSSDSVLLANGSDEAIAIVAQTFIEPGVDVAIVSNPCFSMFPHTLALAGAILRAVPVKPDLSFDVAGIEKALQDKPKLAIFASPENPTGSMLDPDIVISWCRKYPDTLIVIDEAYVEFAPTTVLPRFGECDNLVVLRTFSKAWGMAGLRLGVILAHPTLIEYMLRVRQPYNVNAMAVHTVLALLDKKDEILAEVADIVRRRKWLAGELRKRNYRVVEGHSNSVLISLGINAEEFTDYCYKNGVLVRNRSGGAQRYTANGDNRNGNHDPLWGLVRACAGTEEENERFLQLVDSFSERYGVIFDLDGTLVDTSQSFDATIKELVRRHSGDILSDSELSGLRAEGGFNDDWVATSELLKRRGINIPHAEIVKEATALYLEIAPKTEFPLFELELLNKISSRYRTFIVTGRARHEYDPIWSDRLCSLFHRVYCLDDLPGLKPKPSPDYLLHLKKEFDIEYGVYVGNAVDDMWAARDAGLSRIGITTTLSAETLREAGAQIVIDGLEELEKVYSL